MRETRLYDDLRRGRRAVTVPKNAARRGAARAVVARVEQQSGERRRLARPQPPLVAHGAAARETHG